MVCNSVKKQLNWLVESKYNMRQGRLAFSSSVEDLGPTSVIFYHGDGIMTSSSKKISPAALFFRPHIFGIHPYTNLAPV